ncbi:hypothetical protein Mapa_008340 [Marchantia paleacea]|nr:hypothetical protein Mapa_008340 [Marchantia paleacea]
MSLFGELQQVHHNEANDWKLSSKRYLLEIADSCFTGPYVLTITFRAYLPIQV